MKTKFFTFAMFVAYLCVGSSVKAEPDIIMIELDEVVDSLGHDGDGDGLGGHRGPIAGAVVPTVYYNSGNDELSFETIDEVSFSYYIMDEDDNTLMSGQLSLYENDSTNVSLSSLSPGCYSVIIELNNVYYIGYFTKEDD
ncbi:MAG: hypothetical protein J5661_05920 [Bacteroidaceae bacterium]|nr:hypothetical protein [Bacteroidaceae bacterium]